MSPKASIILPTFNERENIVELISGIQRHLSTELAGYAWEVIVVDDNSPDGTAEHVLARFGASPEVKLFVRKDQRGLASAIRFGIERATGDRIVVMDTDCQHEPKQIPQMVMFLDHYDMITGSRFTVGGGMENETRYFMSFFYNFFLRIILMLQIQDNLSGYFSIRKEKLMEMDLDNIFYGFGDYYMRLLFVAWKKQKLSILAIPVWYPERNAGERKSNFLKMVVGYTVSALRLRLKYR